MDKTRIPDIKQLREDYKKETDPNIRKAMDRAGKNSAREGKPVADMRAALLKEHRRGGKRGLANIKDIHESDNYR